MRLDANNRVILVIPDLQVPYEHRDALDFISEMAEAYAPTDIVCIGDEVDQHCLGRFDTDPEAPGAGDERKQAIRRLKKWYREFPDVRVCTSNHMGRLYKKAFHAGIPEQYLRPIGDWYEAPDGWEWQDRWELDGINFEHGDAQGGMYAARNLAISRMQSTVIGHHHSHGCVNYMSTNKKMIFGMNVGCLIDYHSLAFKYAKGSKFLPTLGCGIISYGVPQFVPMILKGNHRWDRANQPL